jgi:hypothetical protein
MSESQRQLLTVTFAEVRPSGAHRWPSPGVQARGQAIDHASDVAALFGDAVGGRLIEAVDVAGDDDLGFDFRGGGVGDREGNEGIPRSGT